MVGMPARPVSSRDRWGCGTPDRTASSRCVIRRRRRRSLIASAMASRRSDCRRSACARAATAVSCQTSWFIELPCNRRTSSPRGRRSPDPRADVPLSSAPRHKDEICRAYVTSRSRPLPEGGCHGRCHRPEVPCVWVGATGGGAAVGAVRRGRRVGRPRRTDDGRRRGGHEVNGTEGRAAAGPAGPGSGGVCNPGRSGVAHHAGPQRSPPAAARFSRAVRSARTDARRSRRSAPTCRPPARVWAAAQR